MLALLFYVFEEARDTITGPMEEAYREFVTSEPTSLFFWGVKTALSSRFQAEKTVKNWLTTARSKNRSSNRDCELQHFVTVECRGSLKPAFKVIAVNANCCYCKTIVA
jgi:hypothetical protein